CTSGPRTSRPRRLKSRLRKVKPACAGWGRMFSPKVLDHFYRPRNTGPLAEATHVGTAGVPGEGPYMTLWLVVNGERIERAAYHTYGCPAAVACGSVTAEVLAGRTVAQAR